nr:hypothetical protein [uncultured Desulfuromonas sp.]
MVVFWQSLFVRWQRKRMLVLGSLLCLAINAAPVSSCWAANSDQNKIVLTQKQSKDMTSLMFAANRFKTLAQQDFPLAIMTFADTRALAELHEIDQTLWSPEQSIPGWALFWAGAVQLQVPPTAQCSVVGFYNPFDDTILLTAWQKQKNDDLFHIVGAELLMGDWLRTATSEFDLAPKWLRHKAFLPTMLGLSVAETICAFEHVFSNTAMTSWRSALPVLNPAFDKQLNYHSVTMMLNDHFLNALEFNSPADDNLTVQTCNKLTAELLSAAEEGRLTRLLPYADLTLPNTLRRLESVPSQWYRGLQTSYYLQTDSGCQVYLTSPESGANCLVFSFQGQDERLRLRRVDLVDYQFFYEEYSRIKAQQGGV